MTPPPGRALDAGLDWLLHIDGDELFYTPTMDVRPHFRRLQREARTRGVWQAIYLNLEALSATFEVPDPLFEHVDTFKRNPHTLLEAESSQLIPAFTNPPVDRIQYFTGYSVGKAAVRPAAGVEAADVTLFAKPPRAVGGEGKARQGEAHGAEDGKRGASSAHEGSFDRMAVFEGPYILHYNHVGFTSVQRKYRRLANRTADLNQIPFYQSATAMFAPNSTRTAAEDDDAQRALFARFAVLAHWPDLSHLPPRAPVATGKGLGDLSSDKGSLPAILARSLLVRIPGPSLLLQSLRANSLLSGHANGQGEQGGRPDDVGGGVHVGGGTAVWKPMCLDAGGSCRHCIGPWTWIAAIVSCRVATNLTPRAEASGCVRASRRAKAASAARTGSCASRAVLAAHWPRRRAAVHERAGVSALHGTCFRGGGWVSVGWVWALAVRGASERAHTRVRYFRASENVRWHGRSF